MGGRNEKIATGNAERQAEWEAEGRKEREESRCWRMVAAVDRSLEVAFVAVA